MAREQFGSVFVVDLACQEGNKHALHNTARIGGRKILILPRGQLAEQFNLLRDAGGIALPLGARRQNSGSLWIKAQAQQLIAGCDQRGAAVGRSR